MHVLKLYAHVGVHVCHKLLQSYQYCVHVHVQCVCIVIASTHYTHVHIQYMHIYVHMCIYMYIHVTCTSASTVFLYARNYWTSGGLVLERRTSSKMEMHFSCALASTISSTPSSHRLGGGGGGGVEMCRLCRHNFWHISSAHCLRCVMPRFTQRFHMA